MIKMILGAVFFFISMWLGCWGVYTYKEFFPGFPIVMTMIFTCGASMGLFINGLTDHGRYMEDVS